MKEIFFQKSVIRSKNDFEITISRKNHPLKFTASKISAGRIALQTILERGGTPEEARDAFVNAAKITVTGNKYNDKMYHHHTGYVGNLKSVPFKDLLAKKPEEVIQKAVKGMLPKGPLGREMFRKMKVFAGSEHTHQSQQPQVLDI